MKAVSSRVVRSLLTALVGSGVAVTLAQGCGSTASDFSTVPDAGIDGTVGSQGEAGLVGDGSGPGFVDSANPCTGLACAVDPCVGQPTVTSLSGTVFAPNGTLPLYNVVVYVPNAPLDPIPEGPSCDHCGNVSGDPITATITDTSGNFRLDNVPVGSNIPLVIQVGKWRRQVTIPSVAKCVDNPITNKDLTRLPKNQSEGHIPKMAVSTGLCDHLACLLPKLGLDASEYTSNTGTGRLNLYKGATDDESLTEAPAPTGTPPESDLWQNLDSLKKYDMVIMSCECSEHNENKPDAAKQALYDYASLGGRVFASHFHYTWFENSPVALEKNVAEWVGGEPNGDAQAPYDQPFLVDQSFPKGVALAQWLVNVAASTTLGEIPINQPKADVVGVNKQLATRWIYNAPLGLKQTTKYLSFNAPLDVAADQQCGKVVFGDLHITRPDTNSVGGTTTTLPDNNFPASCPATLTPEEKALIFLFFDLSSCVQKESDAPTPPVIK